ncbi:MAG: hypothetical protein BZY88_13305 [SAR202 cluster bacterium Io17-Chloro-G9]|nr:MAG: hypothetical protein BZY88_13305 [SAR202 cluster bacterium Io17-Chloro-G9]
MSDGVYPSSLGTRPVLDQYLRGWLQTPCSAWCGLTNPVITSRKGGQQFAAYSAALILHYLEVF